MPACNSWWQPAVFVTCVSKDKRARTHWSWRGSRASEVARTRWTDCKAFAKLGYRSLRVYINNIVKNSHIVCQPAENNLSNRRWTGPVFFAGLFTLFCACDGGLERVYPHEYFTGLSVASCHSPQPVGLSGEPKGLSRVQQQLGGLGTQQMRQTLPHSERV